MQLFLETTFPVHVHSAAGVVTAVSPAVHSLLAYDDVDLLGLKLRSLLHPDEQRLVDIAGAGSSARVQGRTAVAAQAGALGLVRGVWRSGAQDQSGRRRRAVVVRCA